MPAQSSPSPTLPHHSSLFSFSPPLSFPCCLAGGSRQGRHHLVYMAWSVMWDHSNASICSRGFCVQKIQLKNNYQKISGSPVRLYCLNRCFLFICCNNRMFFLIKEKKRKPMNKERRKRRQKSRPASVFSV